ncbi:hypothetical protein BZA70DRAFT_280284 [Myxozyma melibiosi]|uniref:Enoyl reductase (ER) domain-containing protein n=1 Tax=Myxozyma melibiosi TaxID=54550 RepID=A0ABR1F4Z1_9ASCO
MRSLTIVRADGKPGSVYYDLSLDVTPNFPQPTRSQVLVKIAAAALNHRDHFIRQHLYPGVAFGVTLGSDCVGQVISIGPDVPVKSLIGRRVLVYPAIGWISNITAPEDPASFAILGGTKSYPTGTFADYILLESPSLVHDCPPHLTDPQAAALPLAGLTAYRALFTQGQVTSESTVVVTGAGGGVALYAIQFAKAIGARVYVTTGNQEKLDYAINHLKADGGVLYTAKDWGKQLFSQLQSNGVAGVDAVIDGSGGKSMVQLMSAMKAGCRFVSYGMTTEPRLEMGMAAVLKHIVVAGSTMGSMREFDDMISLVGDRHIVPVVAKTVRGLENAETAFKAFLSSDRIGKVVIEVQQPERANI